MTDITRDMRIFRGAQHIGVLHIPSLVLESADDELQRLYRQACWIPGMFELGNPHAKQSDETVIVDHAYYLRLCEGDIESIYMFVRQLRSRNLVVK